MLYQYILFTMQTIPEYKKFEELQAIVNKVNQTGKLFGLRLNIVKTKMMVISGHRHNTPLNINLNVI